MRNTREITFEEDHRSSLPANSTEIHSIDCLLKHFKVVFVKWIYYIAREAVIDGRRVAKDNVLLILDTVSKRHGKQVPRKR